MTVGDALKQRLEIYDPAPCPRYASALAGIDDTTDARGLMLQLPGFRVDMRRVVPIELRLRWITRQLELAAKAAQQSGE